jgi:hypothetical protein
MLLAVAALSLLIGSACEPCMGNLNCEDGYTAKIDMVDAPVYSNDGLNPNPPLTLTIDQGTGEKKYGFAPGPLVWSTYEFPGGKPTSVCFSSISSEAWVMGLGKPDASGSHPVTIKYPGASPGPVCLTPEQIGTIFQPGKVSCKLHCTNNLR